MNTFLNRSGILASFAGLLIVVGCAREQSVKSPVSQPAYASASSAPPAVSMSPLDQKRVDRNCVFGELVLHPLWNFGPTDLVPRGGYVLMHSATEKIPLWVAEYIEKSQLTGSLARADKFQPDPLLKPGRRAELIDYKGSGYDRGHQAPAGDQTVDARLKAETFYLSNMAPQVPALNQQAWRELETLVRNWILERGSGYVITGPMFYDTNKTNTQPGGDIADYKAIGPDRVAVPTHFFKIVVAKDANGRWQSIAFVLENRKYTKPYDFAKDIKSITWIEQHTGINFMPQLDALEQRRMEASASPMWN